MFRILVSGLLGCALAWAVRKEPVRVVVIANASQLLPEAKEQFEKYYGPGLIDLRFSSEEFRAEDLAQADVIFTHYLRTTVQQALAQDIRTAYQRGALILAAPPESLSDRQWGIPLNQELNKQASAYWEHGGVENLVGFLAFLYRSAGGTRPIPVPPPTPQMSRGIYHPRSTAPFTDLKSYLEWYRTRMPATAPLVGITLYSNTWKSHDLAHIDALIETLEKRGMGAVAAFGWPVHSLADLLTVDGRSPLRVIFTLNATIPRAEDAAAFERWGVHVMNLLVTRETAEEWERNPRGLSPDRISFLLDSPEALGATEPILFATFEPVPGTHVRATRAIPERLQAAVERAQRWIALQDKPNAQKRIALIYYNNPPGKGNIGASYLAVYPTLVNLLQRLRAAGYLVGDRSPDERQVVELLEASGRNVEQWAPGELQEMVARGGLTLISMKQYRRWFSELPARFRQAVAARWGPPEASNLMTIRTADGEKFLVIPGVRFGHIFVGPQPLRTSFAEATNTAHDPETPAPHQYLAFYLWLRHEFKADAVVHIGRHGTLEWLPGKQVAQAGWDHSEVLLGSLPNPYYYIMDGGGEAIQAKRRGAGVLISHLTPMITYGGVLDEFKRLHEALDNLEKTEGQSQELHGEYRRIVRAEVKRLKLDAQLGLDPEQMDWEEIERRVHRFLHDTETNTVPLGIATAGRLPPEPVQRQALTAFLKYHFEEPEAAQLEQHFVAWANDIYQGHKPQMECSCSPALRRKIDTAIAAARHWIENLRKSAEQELDALITVLNGRYLPSAPLGDPIRVPAGLPTGRNLHAMDTSLLPTKAAWAVGRKMAEQFLSRYRQQHGDWPTKVSQVLWYGETNRHQGALECMAFYLLGVEPQWNRRGIVDHFRLIPESELGRPRVDVVFTISGIYRDGMAHLVLLLDQAVRLAASAGDNVISRHDRETAEALARAGVHPQQAQQLARARVFGNKPGAYGVGVSHIVEQSKDAGHSDELAKLFLHKMNYAFSSEAWGITAPDALARHLKGNQAVVFSRSSSLYGALDNDDTYQYFGALGLASRAINGGTAPEMLLGNLRKPGAESLQDLKTWLASELNTRHWNPTWLQALQSSGYAGARAMFKEIEHLYGFQATTPEQMDGVFWQKTFDVFVKDKYGLGLKEFFAQNNPHAEQWILSRLLEVDRQGSYRFSDADRAELIRRYVQSVAAHGAACSANTCGNKRLHEAIVHQLPMVSGLGNREKVRFAENLARATRGRAHASTVAVPVVRTALTRAVRRPALQSSIPPSRTAQLLVEGFRMEESTRRLPVHHSATRPTFIAACGVLGAMLAGALLEFRRTSAG